jgi:branched-chain amino acid transport system permease protein
VTSRLDFRTESKSVDTIATVLLVAVFASVPLWADKGLLFLASVVMINAVFALSFNLVFGLTGLVSFGHAAFFAVGAYTTGLLLQRFIDVPYFASWFAGGVSGALVATIVATVALRRSAGIYFAILTLALAELVHILIAKSTLLGREDGLTGIKRPIVDFGLFRLDLAAGNNLYYVTLICSTALGAILYWLWHNRLGRLLGAIRQDAERVRFLGVNVHAFQFAAFVLSGGVAGLAGGLYAPVAQLLTPELAHWSSSALPILFCLVGGVSYFWGPVVGTVVFIVGLSEVIIGLVLLLVVLVFPGGLIGGMRKLRTGRSRGKAPKLTNGARTQESS